MRINYRMNFSILSTLFFLNSAGQTLPEVKLSTPLGEIVLEIDTLNAPVTAKNFLYHVEIGTYKNAVFYRAVRMDNQPQNDIKIEVIQGGVFVEVRFEKIETIRHETTKETGLKHLNGTISMARAETGTASTEFFICIEDQPELDFGGKRNAGGLVFATFGKEIKGVGVVLDIQHLKDNISALDEKLGMSKMLV